MTKSDSRLWYGVSVPATAFLAQEIASTMIASRLCHDGAPRLARALVVAIFAVMQVLSISAAVVGYRSWRELHGALGVHPSEGSREMAALFALLVGIVMSLGIFWSGAAALLLDICEATR